jgi:hypothetical protein
MFIPDPYLDFLSTPNPGSIGQKAPDPGSGSVRLAQTIQKKSGKNRVIKEKYFVLSITTYH